MIFWLFRLFNHRIQKLNAGIGIIRLVAGVFITLAQIIFLSATGIAALVFVVGLIRRKDNRDCNRLW